MSAAAWPKAAKRGGSQRGGVNVVCLGIVAMFLLTCVVAATRGGNSRRGMAGNQCLVSWKQ